MDKTATTSSKQALELFKADPQSFDLVITDQTMQELSGDVLIKEMRALRSDLPVILCTGYSALIDQSRADELGINQFLMKPYRMDELGGIVANLLTKSRAGSPKA